LGGIHGTAGDAAEENARRKSGEAKRSGCGRTVIRRCVTPSVSEGPGGAGGAPPVRPGPGRDRDSFTTSEDGAPHPALRATFSPQAGRRTWGWEGPRPACGERVAEGRVRGAILPNARLLQFRNRHINRQLALDLVAQQRPRLL